jgi:ABC-type polysaccharide/polyol phosphate transport system ATPase subunit
LKQFYQFLLHLHLQLLIGADLKMKSLKSSDDQLLVELVKINVLFDLKRIKHNSIKDLVVSFTQKPLDTIFSREDIFHCLKNISISIKNGDHIGLLGRNGSGKTTLCQVLSGNIHPNEGSISRNCKIRSVYHSTTHLFPELSGRENAKILTRLLYPSVSKLELKEISEESISFSDLGIFANAPIKTYSKGMSTRLLLSLVTARPSELLIMDELFDGADQFFMDKFTPRLESIIQRSNSTLFINHDINLLKKYCNRIIVLNEGEVCFDGMPLKGFYFYENQNWLTR